MKSSIRILFGLFGILLSVSAFAQVNREVTASTAIATAIVRLGGSSQTDSLALGTVEFTQSRSNESGTARIVTKGSEQTREEIIALTSGKLQVYSRGRTNEIVSGAPKNKVFNALNSSSFELELTAQSAAFPLPWLINKYVNPDQAFEVVADGGATSNVVHLRITNTFASDPNLQRYASLTTSDVWLDAQTGLPRKIGFERREASGATPAIPVAYEYSDYRTIQGVTYPFSIRKYVNGTLWAVITIQSVSVNSGVLDSEFALQ